MISAGTIGEGKKKKKGVVPTKKTAERGMIKP
jgi:hypothetical protein